MNIERQAKEQEQDESFYLNEEEGAPKQEQDQQNLQDKSIGRLKKIRKSKMASLLPELYKSQKKKKKGDQIKQIAKDIANDLIRQMDQRYMKDIHKLKQKKPANFKILYLSILKRELKKIAICEQFLDSNGLTHFQRWLKKLPNGDQPCLALRKGVLQILLFLNVSQQYLSKVGQLYRIVSKHRHSVTKQLRDLSQQIITKWNKILLKNEEQ